MKNFLSFFKKPPETSQRPPEKLPSIPMPALNSMTEQTEQKVITPSKMQVKSSENKFDFSMEEDEDEDEREENNGGSGGETSAENSSGSREVTFDYKEPEEVEFNIAHQLYIKNSMLDIEGMPYISFIKIKKNDGILSFFNNLTNKKPYTEKKYLALFDEHFIYHINMTSKENNQNNYYKKIGNHYNLKQLSNVEIKEDNILPGSKIIVLLFIIDNGINSFQSVTKEYHLELNNTIKFFNILKFYLDKYEIPLQFKDSQNYGGGSVDEIKE